MKYLVLLCFSLCLFGCSSKPENIVYRDVYHYNIIYGFDSKVKNPQTGKYYKDFEVISNELNRQINTNNNQAEILAQKNKESLDE